MTNCNLTEQSGAERNKAQNLGVTPAPVLSEGPAPIAPFNWSGAVERIVLDPSNPTVLHAATVGGGMFVTSDYTANPSSWNATTDMMPSLAMGDVAVDPTDTQHLVAGTGCSSANAWYCGRISDGASRPVNGFLYESTNGGASWSSPIVDAALQNKTIQAVTVRGDIILVATGRGGAGDIVRGVAGTFGSRAGLGDLPPTFGSVYDLVADPTDAQRYFAVMASAGVGNGGVYSTPDAGLTWTRVSDNHADPQGLNYVLNRHRFDAQGAVDPQGANIVNNARLAVSPTGRLFVVVGLVAGAPQKESGQAALVAYTDDAGQTWDTMDLPSFLFGESATQGGPLPVASITRSAGNERIVLDCGVNHGLGDNDFVRLAGIDPFGTNSEDLNGDWRMTVVSPTQIALLDRFTGQEGTGQTDGDMDTSGTWTGWAGGNRGGQTGYGHLAITVDPGNHDRIYLAGDAGPGFVARGNLGGTPGLVPSQQWTSVIDGETANVTRPHADVRDLLVDGNGNLLAATDGGIFLRTSPTNSTGDWTGIPGNMVNGEMLTIAIDPVSNTLIGGLQDNGTPGQTSQMLVGPQPWGFLWGGDGRGVAAVDAGNTFPGTGARMSHRYMTDQNENWFTRRDCDSSLVCVQYPNPNPADPNSVDFKVIELRVADSNPPQFVKDVDDIGWLQTMVTNPLAPDRLLLGAAQQGIWESTDLGATASLVVGSPKAAKDIVAGAGGNPEALWAVSDAPESDPPDPAPDAGVYSRFAAGAAMVRSASFPEPGALAVTMSPSDPQVAYVATDLNVYRTSDGGGTWESITGDLTATTLRIAGVAFNGQPSELRDMVYVESAQGDRVVVGAARGTTGVYMMAVDNPGTWMRIGNDLPNVSVYALEYDPAADALAVATHGRGAWSIENVSTLNRAPEARCKDFTASANASCQANAIASSFNDGSTDPEGTSLLFYSVYAPVDLQQSNTGPKGLGSHDVTIRVADNQGSVALCGPVKFHVVDDTPPELAVPPDVQVALCGSSEVVNVGQATMDDNCSTSTPTGQVVSKNGAPLSPPVPVVGGQVELDPGVYVIEWTADDGSNPPVTETQSVSVGGAIVAYDKYEVRDRAEVVDTSANPAAVFNAGSGATIIGGDGAHVGSVVAGGDVTVYSGGIVDGDITAVGSIQAWGTHNGNEVSVSSVDLPAAPALPSFPPSNTDDRWIDSQNPPMDVTLPPGRYRNVGVNGNPDPSYAAIMRLEAGDYFIDNLYLHADGLIVVAQPGTRIFVSGQLSFHTPIVTSTSADELVPVVLGLTGSGDAELYAPFLGTVIAPQRNLALGTDNGMSFTGSFYADSIDLRPDSSLVCDTSVTVTEPLTCSNSMLVLGETDVDCGGPVCPTCDDGQTCTVGPDCESKVCQSDVCQVPTCSDGIENGSETGPDCGGTCSTCPVSCNPGNYQAENMYHTTGNAWWQGGWNIYDNGYIATTHDFSAGPATITVWALGQEAFGLPHMTVMVDGVTTQPSAGYLVSTGGFNPYEFTFTASGGAQEVRIIYDNDYFDGSNDRNLIVQTVAVDCP